MTSCYVLGIESSCDETAMAIYNLDSKCIVAHVVKSQLCHQQLGGVMPELAAREHLPQLSIILQQVLTQAKINTSQLKAIGYTKGPGLAGCLLVGASFAKALAYSLNIPAIAVNHLAAHLSITQLQQPHLDPNIISKPYLGLLISGGHTILTKIHPKNIYQTLGQTLDDAVGEAFDKVAKMLALPYPGGPNVANMATKGNPNTFKFPISMQNQPNNYNFSFSGLKTWTRRVIQQNEKNLTPDIKADICAGFQNAAINSLLVQCKKAVNNLKIYQLVVAGGVACNQLLRTKLQHFSKKYNVEVYTPSPELCTDNGAMIAHNAAQLLLQQQLDINFDINIRTKWPL